MTDKTFEWTDSLNRFLLDNLIARDWLIIFNSACFDITILFLLFLYKADKLPSLSFVLALVFSALLKTVTQ